MLFPIGTKRRPMPVPKESTAAAFKKNLPSPELTEQIREGMTYEKVTDILGLPQYQMIRSLIVFAYKLNDGTEFAVQYSKNDSGQYIVAETNCK